MLCACVRRLSLLEQLLRGRLEARKLQKHLREAFPAAAVEEHLREYADKAWAALGDTSLQVRLEVEGPGPLAGRDGGQGPPVHMETAGVSSMQVC